MKQKQRPFASLRVTSMVGRAKHDFREACTPLLAATAPATNTIAYHWPRSMKTYYVYILASKSLVLYTGVTNNLERRVGEHKEKRTAGFTSRYNVNRLVYFEDTHDINAAIAREKQIKGWLRQRKIALIESTNPTWRDLSDDWLKTTPAAG